jgi:hypothetical protein
MKKTLLLTAILFTLNTMNAQNLNYGVLLGYSGYDIEIDGPAFSGGAFSSLNIGGFGEYKLNNRLGIRGNIIYSKVQEDDYYALVLGKGYAKFLDKIELNTLQIHTLLKLDVRKDYNKGFYLIGGFRMTHILNAKSDGDEIDGFYKDSNFGVMFGFGVNFAKYFGLELIPETNITNTLDSDNKTAKNFGAYANLTINLASIFKKKV